MEKYRNKYRVQSHRKPNWDYSADGLYFLTIVTQKMECNLGKIVCTNGQTPQMQLSEFGKIVEHEWFKSFEIRIELILHEFILMPNHLHAIVEINNQNHFIPIPPVQTHDRVSLPIDPIPLIQTHGRVSTY